MQLPPWSSHAIDYVDNFRNHGGNSKVFMTGVATHCMQLFPKKTPVPDERKGQGNHWPTTNVI